MNHLEMMQRFFEAVKDDNRITPMHISLYMSLLYLSLVNNTGTLYLFSKEVMPFVKYSSSATYHKCLRDLHLFGYIQYTPSYNHFLGSLIELAKVNNN